MRVKGAKRNPKLVEIDVTINVTVNGPKSKIHNVFIIDASGSMQGSKYNNAIMGVNELLSSIKADTDTVNTVSIIEFRDTSILRRLELEPSTPKMAEYRGLGAMGGTPLNQAVGETLEWIVYTRNNTHSATDKILVSVFTDGGENQSSGKYAGRLGATLLGKLIKELEEQGVTTTFVGTQEEVNYAINTLHVFASNTSVHDNTSLGVRNVFDRTVKARKAYSKSVAVGENVVQSFYTKTVEQDKK